MGVVPPVPRCEAFATGIWKLYIPTCYCLQHGSGAGRKLSRIQGESNQIQEQCMWTWCSDYSDPYTCGCRLRELAGCTGQIEQHCLELPGCQKSCK
uniref:Uncharacterized protein n=1 Tax=Brassica oleracea var. oleracea TaxID=109376 RepID=A0A0D3AB63_BRAOL